MDVLTQLYGQWRIKAGGVVGPVPPEVLDQRTLELEVRDDGRGSDVGRLLRLRSGGATGLGLVEVEVDDDTTLRGAWRVSPAGAFLADTGGGEGPNIGEFFRPRPWLHDATWVTVEGDELTLRDVAGQQSAHLVRDGGWRARRAAPPAPARAEGLPAELIPARRDQLLGAWEPLFTPPNSWPGQRWQDLEFADDGWWHAYPAINIGRGRWRHWPDGTLFAFHGGGKTWKANSHWLDLDPWLYPVARAGFDGDGRLVLLDDANRELQRLQRSSSEHRQT